MENTLKIGTNNDLIISYEAEQMFVKLTQKGIKCEMVFIDTSSSSNEISVFTEAIKSNKIHTAPVELALLPFYKSNDDVIITAISGRNNLGEGILLKKKNSDSDVKNKMAAGLVIGVKTERQYKQLHHLFSDQEFKLIQDSVEKDKVITVPAYLDGMILSKYLFHLHPELITDYTFISLNPKELIPAPGHDIVAYLCHREEINTRKILNLIHNNSIVPSSNIERMVLSMVEHEFANTIGAYCQTDNRGYFHVHAVRCDQFKKVSFSQSISAGLAEKIYQSLFS